MKIEIEWITDEFDCEICGASYATGAIVRDETGKEILNFEPVAHCYSGVTYEPTQILIALIEHLGHQVTERNGL